MVGVVCSGLVWVSWNYLSRVRPFSKVDDALGVVYTHGIAGLLGGLLVGRARGPRHDRVRGVGEEPRRRGLLQRRRASSTRTACHQLWEQFLAASWIIVLHRRRDLPHPPGGQGSSRAGCASPTTCLEVGDLAIHDEEAFPRETFAERVGALSRRATATAAATAMATATGRRHRRHRQGEGAA